MTRVRASIDAGRDLASGLGEAGPDLASGLGEDRPERPALRIALIYAVVAALWIFFSDEALDRALGGAPGSVHWHTAKGLGYVVATAGLLHALVRRYVAGLRNAREQLRTILEGMSDAVLVASADGAVRAMNGAAVALFGAPSAAALLAEPGGPRARLRSRWGGPVEEADDPFARALAGRAVAATELRVVRPGGEEVWVSASAAPVVEGGRVCMAVAVLRDVREAKRAEALRDRFLAAAAHELKTPLASIRGYVQLLERWAPPGRPEREAAAHQVICRQVDRMNHIVHALLEANPETLADVQLRRERVDLNDLVAEVVEQVRPSAPRRRIVLEVGDPAPVLGDRAELDAALRQLLDNAVRFSDDGGTVSARVRVASGEAIVSVQDRGIGIPAERRDDLFEPFARGHSGTPHQARDGVGIGLHVTRTIVEHHGGRVWFESREGRGSTFHVGLPLASPAVERSDGP